MNPVIINLSFQNWYIRTLKTRMSLFSFFPVAQVVDTITSLQDDEAQHISQLLQEYDNNRRQVAETLEDLRNCSI